MLHMTVTRMLTEMSAAEFADWQAFFAWDKGRQDSDFHKQRASEYARRASRGVFE